MSTSGHGKKSPDRTRIPRKQKHGNTSRPHRWKFHGTLVFVVVLWAANITLAFLQNNCGGFVSKDFWQSFLSLQQRRRHRWHHHHRRGVLATNNFRLAAAATSGDTEEEESISSILTLDRDNGDQTVNEGSTAKISTESTSFSLQLPSTKPRRRRRASQFLKREGANANTRTARTTTRSLEFVYDYDVIDFPIETATTNSRAKLGTTTGILFVHPIGVGIARWYYQRLVRSLVARHAGATIKGANKTNSDNNQQRSYQHRVVVLVPDLLGSGSACNATISTTATTEGHNHHVNGQTASAHRNEEVAERFPLFNISDWTGQLEVLMSSVERTSEIDRWCVVANGGCSPIALQLAERKQLVRTTNSTSTATADIDGAPVASAPVSNLILSSVPRLPFFLKNETTNDPNKVEKSYRTLSGIPGNLFWWYACRNEGAFIQTFSEKNLIADPSNLGPFWRSNCCQTAVSHKGRGKYATFSFLAGTLQDGCLSSLDAVKETPLRIDVIKGADVRRNRAKSWFWQKPKNGNIDGNDNNKMDGKNNRAVNNSSNDNQIEIEDVGDSVTSTQEKSYQTFRDYVETNGNGGREILIGGRISLAHEDPDGYADAILEFLFGN